MLIKKQTDSKACSMQCFIFLLNKVLCILLHSIIVFSIFIDKNQVRFWQLYERESLRNWILGFSSNSSPDLHRGMYKDKEVTVHKLGGEPTIFQNGQYVKKLLGYHTKITSFKVLRLDKNNWLILVPRPTVAQRMPVRRLNTPCEGFSKKIVKSVRSHSTIINFDRKFDLFHLTPVW